MEHMAGFWLGGTTFGKKVAIINSGIKPFQNRIQNEHAYPLLIIHKVEKVLKGSLDLIPSPSPSVKIQIIDGESLLEV